MVKVVEKKRGSRDVHREITSYKDELKAKRLPTNSLPTSAKILLESRSRLAARGR